MKKNNEFKKVSIKTSTCYYFDGIIKFEHLDFSNVLQDEKSCKNILVYEIFYKALIGTKPLHIMFFKVNEFIRVYGVYDEAKYLVLFGLKKYDAIYDRIRYRIGLKCRITYLEM